MFILISAWTRRTGLAKSCTQNRHMMRNRYSSHFSFPNNSSTFNLSIPHFSWKIDFILFTILSIDSLILKRDFVFNFIFPVLQTSISSISSCSVKKTRLVLSVCIFSLDQYQLMGLKKTSKYFLSKQCFHISQYYVTIPHFATAQNYLSRNLARIEFQAGGEILVHIWAASLNDAVKSQNSTRTRNSWQFETLQLMHFLQHWHMQLHN